MMACLQFVVLHGSRLLDLRLPHHRALLRPANLCLRSDRRLDLW